LIKTLIEHAQTGVGSLRIEIWELCRIRVRLKLNASTINPDKPLLASIGARARLNDQHMVAYQAG